MAAHSDGDQLAMLIERLADLEATVREQQAEIALLRTGVADPHDSMVVDEHAAERAGVAAVAVSPMEAPEPLPTMPRKSRRALLKLGGAAAAAGVAAVAAGATELAHSGAAHAHADTVGLYQNINGLGNVAIKGDGGQGAHGVEGTTDSGRGLYGLSFTGDALYAESTQGGIGVHGKTTSSTAVYGENTGFGNGVLGAGSYIGVKGSGGTFGVYGSSQNSIGVYGDGRTGGYFHGSSATIFLQPYLTITGAPTGFHNSGEVFVDANSVLWYCAVGGDPAMWIRLSGPPSGYAGGAIAYLPAPIRLFDTRSDFGQGVPLPASKGALAGQSTTTIQVTGTIPVPAGATGVFGNLTVSNTQGGGDLILYPHGAPQPNASNINYVQGQTIANAFNVGLSSGGAMDLFVHVHGTDVIIDIAGFVF